MPFPLSANELTVGRRQLLRGATALAGTALPWIAQGQTGKTSAGSRPVVVAQVVDMSPEQIDVSKDFLTGARTALAELNAHGGLRGTPLQHLVLEVDGSRAALQAVVERLRQTPQCVAAFGTVGHLAAGQTAQLLERELPDLAHIAPWLQSTGANVPETSFPIFAGRREQILHALKSLAGMGITQVGVVFASEAERRSSQADLDLLGPALGLRTVPLPPQADLQRLGQSLGADSPRVLLFIGGTPELMALAQGIGRQAQQRYIVALADVNVQTLQQSGLPRHAAVIATQVVPLLNAQTPLVRQYREALARLYDEPPSPQSLAGFVAARYTAEALRQVDGPLQRGTVLASLQQRRTLDLGGFPIAVSPTRRSGGFVTQSMLASDGRFIG